MIDRARLHGVIGYFTSTGEPTGRERFALSHHADGSRTLRAQCELDDLGVVRDCVLALDPEWRPTEAYVRTMARGAHAGSAWFRFADDGAYCHGVAADGAPFGQHEPTAGRAPFFGTHSLVNDGWLARLARPAQGEPVLMADLPACSLAADGATPPRIELGSATVSYLGDEEITVAAGSFHCRRHAIAYGDFPPLEAWTTGEHHLLVQMRWTHLDGLYTLRSLAGA